MTACGADTVSDTEDTKIQSNTDTPSCHEIICYTSNKTVLKSLTKMQLVWSILARDKNQLDVSHVQVCYLLLAFHSSESDIVMSLLSHSQKNNAYFRWVWFRTVSVDVKFQHPSKRQRWHSSSWFLIQSKKIGIMQQILISWHHGCHSKEVSLNIFSRFGFKNWCNEVFS